MKYFENWRFFWIKCALKSLTNFSQCLHLFAPSLMLSCRKDIFFGKWKRRISAQNRSTSEWALHTNRNSLLLSNLQYLEFMNLIIGIIQFLTWLVSEWHLWVPLKVWSWEAETERSESHWLISRRLTSTSKERNPSNLLEKSGVNIYT